jgi:hypothetical protein
LVIRVMILGTDAVEDVFFCLDSRTLNFDSSSLRQRKRFATEGFQILSLSFPFIVCEG